MMAKIKLTPIVPRGKILDERKLNRELENALDHTINIVKDDFERTVRTWDNKPKFEKTGPRRRFGELEAICSTDNEIYSYLEYGTVSKVRVPRKPGGVLVFRSKYIPKTRSGVIGSRSGGASGGLVFAKKTKPKAIQARMFSKTIAQRRQKNLINLVRLAYNRAVT